VNIDNPGSGSVNLHLLAPQLQDLCLGGIKSLQFSFIGLE
jgi:hypothetical protein